MSCARFFRRFLAEITSKTAKARRPVGKPSHYTQGVKQASDIPPEHDAYVSTSLIERAVEIVRDHARDENTNYRQDRPEDGGSKADQIFFPFHGWILRTALGTKT